MGPQDFSKFFIYRWRYVIGYTLVGLLLAGLLLFAGLSVPGGLSDAEKTAVVRSSALSISDPSTWAVPNLPFLILQRLSLMIFGISEFTIKLPSLILGLLSAIGLIFLLRRWFPPSIAVLASLIAVTTGQFLFVAQSGGANIMYIFWPVALLLIGTQITRGKRWRLLWKILFALTAAMSLYTPLSIYVLIAIVITISLHPHLRNVVRRLSKAKIALGLSLALIILAPLAYSLILNPRLGLTLLGIPTQDWPPDILANIQRQLSQFFTFWQPSATSVMTPVFGLGSVLLIGLGLYRLIRTRETTRSYLVIIWIACLIPVFLINPLFITVVFVPAVLLLAAGLTSLIGYWYRLFPLNPYARVAGLIPIIVLVTTLIASGIDRYMYGYHYSPNIASNYSRDLKLLPKERITLLVSSDEQDFYKAIAQYRPDLRVTTSVIPSSNSFYATRAARDKVSPANYEITMIRTSASAQEADRFYQYQKLSE